jgi:hypothetical protein
MGRHLRSRSSAVLLRQANSLLYAFLIREHIFVHIMPRPAAGDEEDAKEGEQTAADELGSLSRSCALKVPV